MKKLLVKLTVYTEGQQFSYPHLRSQSGGLLELKCHFRMWLQCYPFHAEGPGTPLPQGLALPSVGRPLKLSDAP